MSGPVPGPGVDSSSGLILLPDSSSGLVLDFGLVLVIDSGPGPVLVLDSGSGLYLYLIHCVTYQTSISTSTGIGADTVWLLDVNPVKIKCS